MPHVSKKRKVDTDGSSEAPAESSMQESPAISCTGTEGSTWYGVCWDGDWVPEAKRRETVDFYYAWENIIVHEDNCFLYNDDGLSISAFTSRMNDQTPEDFALAALEREDEAFKFAKSKVSNEQDLIPNMLAFWKAKVWEWRIKYGSKEEVREKFDARKSWMDKMSCVVKQRVHRTPEGELSLAVVLVRFGHGKQHRCVARVLPVLVDDAVDYRVQGIDLCHEGCSPLQFNLAEQVQAECQGDSMLLRGIASIEGGDGLVGLVVGSRDVSGGASG